MYGIVFDVQRFAGIDINNDANDTLIEGTEEKDAIYNWSGENVTIISGDGDDNISNYAPNVTINAGNGDNYIYNSNNSVSIDTGNGDDRIIIDGSSYTENITINAGAGNDYISKRGGKNVIIATGAGDDSIYNSGSFTAISTGEGDDSIYNAEGSNLTINTGVGNDTVSLGGSYNRYNKIQYASGDGNDIVYGFNTSDTIQITNGIYSTLTSDNDFIISIGDDSLILKDALIDPYTQIHIQDSTGSMSIYNNWSILNGTSSDDSLLNYLDNVTINAVEGNNRIDNYGGQNVVINTGSGNDSIFNSRFSGSDSLKVNAGDGNNIVSNLGNSSTITTGVGNDNISNSGNNVLIDGGAGNNGISNSGKNVTVSVGAGNDRIYNSSDSVIIEAGDGNDTIENYSDGEVTINAGKGDDYITNNYYYNYSKTKFQYVLGDGNDTIYNFKSSDTIQIIGGTYSTMVSDKDFIISVGEDSIRLLFALDDPFNQTHIQDSDGSMSVYNDWSIMSGTSNKDKLINYLDNITIDSGDGNDTIESYGSYVSINGGTGNNSIENKNGDNVTINTNSGDNYILNSLGSNVEITAGDGNNYIFNDGYYEYKGKLLTAENVAIISGAGNDSIGSENMNHVTIDSGAGDDNIYYSTYLLDNVHDIIINAGDGNDTIGGSPYVSRGENITINAGKGDDYISVVNDKNVLIQYKGGDGNDTVYGLNADDTLQISGAKYTTIASGEDLIFTVGSGKITVVGGTNTTFNIDGTLDSGIDITPADTLPVGISVKSGFLTASSKFTGSEIDTADYENVTKINAAALSQAVTIIGSDSVTSIKGGKNSDIITGGNGKNTIFGGAGDDSIIGGTDNDILKGDAGADTISGGIGKNTLTGGKGNDIFVYGGGNDLIADYKPNEDKINFNVADIESSTVKGSDVILTTGEGTISIKGAKDKVVTFIDNSGEDTELIFFGDTYYVPLETGLTYDAKRTILTASNKFGGNEIDLENYLSSVTKVNASALSKNLEITATDSVTSIKSGKGADTISSGNGKNTIYGGADNDSILGGTNEDRLFGDAGNDTLNGGTGNNTLTGGAGADVFIHEDGNDFIADYKPGDDTIILTNGTVNNSSLKNSDIILYTDDGDITIKGGKGKKITVTDGAGNTTTQIYGLFNYNEDKTAILLTSGFTGSLKAADYNSSVEEIDASQVKTATKIFGNDNDNTILGSVKVDSIYGGNGDDSIFGDAGNDKIFGEVGDDSLNGGKGNDTLTGGTGKDVFIYSNGDGNDVIADFVSGEDVIKLESGTVSNYSVSGGKDAILKVGSGKITLKNVGNEKITVIGADNSETVYGLADGLNFDKADLSKAVSVTISADYESESFDATNYKSLVKIDASAVNNEIEIIGNAKNNSIIASKGGSTISGGKGNDTLIGGAGEDLFIYSAGKDVIANYSADDAIKISSGTITKTAYKGEDVIFNIGSSSITVKDGNGKNITITDANGVTTSEIYSNAKTLNLIEDNNFMTDEFNLDEISEQIFEVTQIQTADNSTEFNADNLITYGENK